MRHARRLAVFLLFSGMIVSFQNCAQSGFSSAEMSATDWESYYKRLPKSCSFGTQVLAHGQNVVAYRSSEGPCVSEVRTCDDGVLSGSYGAASCATAPEADCAFQGLSIPSQISVTAFQRELVGFGEACQQQVRSCSNGVLSGTYPARTCKIAPPEFWGTFNQVCRNSPGGLMRVRALTFNGNSVRAQIDLSGNANCASPSYQIEVDMTMSLPPANFGFNGTYPVSFQRTRMTLRANSASAVATLNSMGTCAPGGTWVVNTARVVNDLTACGLSGIPFTAAVTGTILKWTPSSKQLLFGALDGSPVANVLDGVPFTGGGGTGMAPEPEPQAVQPSPTDSGGFYWW